MGRVLVVVLAIYGILRFEDLLSRGVLRQVFVPGYEQRFFLLEIFLSVIIPLALLLIPKIRNSAQGLYLVAVLILLGFVTNRLNVTITGVENAVGGRYTPRWTEVVITAMFVALGFAIFGLAVRYLPIFPEEKKLTLRPPACRRRSLPSWRSLYMPETDQSDAQLGPFASGKMGRSISFKLMASIFVVMTLIFGLLTYLTIAPAPQAPGSGGVGQRRTAERGAAPQCLALHAEERPCRPVRNDDQHGRSAGHGASPHHELGGSHQLFDPAR